MKCWRWILIALVALSLGCVLFPTTSSAAHRSAVSAWVEGAGPSDGGNSLMGDPDGGGGYTGGNQGYIHDFRVRKASGGAPFAERLWTLLLRSHFNQIHIAR